MLFNSNKSWRFIITNQRKIHLLYICVTTTILLHTLFWTKLCKLHSVGTVQSSLSFKTIGVLHVNIKLVHLCLQNTSMLKAPNRPSVSRPKRVGTVITAGLRTCLKCEPWFMTPYISETLSSTLLLKGNESKTCLVSNATARKILSSNRLVQYRRLFLLRT